MTVRFIIDNAHADATLTATSEALAIENTQNSRRAYVWRSADTEVQTITGTPTPSAASGFVMARHNLSSLATVQLLLKKAGTTVYDSGALSVGEPIPAGVWRAGIDPYGATYNERLDPQIFNIWFDPVFFDEYEIMINDTTNAAGFLELGQIFLGLAFEPLYGMSFGVQMQWIEQTEHQRTDGGSLRSEGTHAKHRKINFGLDWLGDTDRTAMLVDFFDAGKRSDVFISAYPEAAGMLEIEHAFVARRMNDLGFIHPFASNWTSNFGFEEV